MRKTYTDVSPPRYLVPCCVEKMHTIRDAYNQAVDMEKYTNVFNQFIKEWMSLPKNCEFYDYRAVLSGPLSKEDYTDRVHFTHPVKERFANFIISCLFKKPTSAVVRPPPSQTFHKSLLAAKIYVTKEETLPPPSH